MYKPFIEIELEKHIECGAIKKIMLYEPTNIHRPLTAKIESMMMGGMAKIQQAMGSDNVPDQSSDSDDKEENPFAKISATQMLVTLKMVPSDNYDFYVEFCDLFKLLMLSDNICKPVDSDKKITVAQYDELSAKDADRIMGGYLKSFFM